MPEVRDDEGGEDVSEVVVVVRVVLMSSAVGVRVVGILANRVL